MKGKTNMIVNAIELKKKITLQSPSNDIINKEPTYVGHPGDYLITTIEGNQGIIPKEIFEEMELNSHFSITFVLQESPSPKVERRLYLPTLDKTID